MKQPPIAKIYEALTSIASKRIKLESNEAIVYSSDNKKSYKVLWKDNLYTSNDNATFWQGYPGYPVIAVLLLQNKLFLDETVLTYLKDINWHELNEKYKRNYDKAVASVLDNFEESIKAKALDNDNVKKHIDGKEIVKVIVIKGKIVNIVVK